MVVSNLLKIKINIFEFLNKTQFSGNKAIVLKLNNMHVRICRKIPLKLKMYGGDLN